MPVNTHEPCRSRGRMHSNERAPYNVNVHVQRRGDISTCDAHVTCDEAARVFETNHSAQRSTRIVVTRSASAFAARTCKQRPAPARRLVTFRNLWSSDKRQRQKNRILLALEGKFEIRQNSLDMAAMNLRGENYEVRAYS